MTPKRMFFIMLAAVALVAAGTGFAYLRTRGQLNEKAENLSHLKADVDAIDDSIEDVKEVLAQYDDLSFIDEIASEVLPPEKVQSNLIGQIYTLANEANVTVSTLSFSSPEGTKTNDPSLTQTKPLEGVPGVYVLPINLTYETGSYSNFIKLLRKFEDNRRKLQIANLGISPITESIEGGDGASSIVGYQGSLEINVYVRP